MRTLVRITAVTLCCFGAPALADRYDFRIYQLGNPDPNGANFNPSANANFRTLARELGAVISSANLSPPETLGHSGFAINAELSLVDLQPSKFVLPTERPLNGLLLVPSVHVRKGLPFSVELGGRLSWIEKSRMFAVTGEAKYALNEGFAYLPDLAIRGHVSRLINARDLHLTTVGADLSIGKRFAIGGMTTLTPYVGWNLVWVAANSDQVDFNPARTQQEAISAPTAQLLDTNVFDEVLLGQNNHNRFYGGLRFVGGVVQLGGEVSISSLGKFKDESGSDVTPPQVVAYNVTLGLTF